MGITTKKGSDEREHSSHRPAAAIHAGQRQTATLIDNRHSTSLQRQLIEGIDNAPQSIAQRQLQAQMETAQRAAPEEEELLQGKFETAQRVAPEEEELLQGKFEAAPSANKTGMPDNLKSGIESLSGMDMSDVQVHRNSSKPAQLNALAYAQGNDIHLGAGQEQHLPHEAWHVVQQRQGRVKPTMQMAGVEVNDDVSLEREADVMGGRALQMKGGGQKARPDHIGADPIGANGLIPITQHDTTTCTIQRRAIVVLSTDEDKKKSIHAWGTVGEFRNGTDAGTRGWVGVKSYRAWYQIDSRDGKYQNSGDVGPLKNAFTRPEAGHVLGKQNGGDGSDPENIFAQCGGANNSTYKRFENDMRNALRLYDKKDKVDFKCYLKGDHIQEGTIADAELSSASDISSDEE